MSMETFTKAQKARFAIRLIKITADALVLRGYYKPSGKSGQKLSEGLKILSPEIYGSMNDSRIVELKGLEYVIERLPMGIERCNRVILTAREDFENTSFEKIIPPKRRRTSYKLSDNEICFIITRGLSEIYDILTHLTFLNIESHKIHSHMIDRDGSLTYQWVELEKVVQKKKKMKPDELDHALWNLSIILGRTFHETKKSYEYLEKYASENHGNHILFQIIYGMGIRCEEEKKSRHNELLISFTPSLNEMVSNHNYGQTWATNIKSKIKELGFWKRPLHIVSANLHSFLNTIYAYTALKEDRKKSGTESFYEFINENIEKDEEIYSFAKKQGFYYLPDQSGTHIDCQIIDTEKLSGIVFHPALNINLPEENSKKPIILIIDYAFGTQAFEVMDELLEPFEIGDGTAPLLNVKSISVMGKAGILPGKKGDIMLGTSHVFEGTSDNYIVNNDINEEDFDKDINVYTGPILTVVGTSLQNRDVLKRFQESDWKAVGLEMEGGHYQKAISSAIIKGHIHKNTKTRYAYYASDNPLLSGQTLSSGSMGAEGIKPTYMITKVILEKILGQK